MIFGPVLRRELLILAKRRETFGERSVSVGLVLVVLAAVAGTWWYQGWDWESLEGIRQFGLVAFGAVVALFAMSVAGLTSASYTATVLAGERDRKSLDAVLATRLTSGEIIRGVVGAGMVRALAGLLTVLPAMTLMVVFAGIDPRLLLLAYLGLFTTAFAAVGVAVAMGAVMSTAKRAISWAVLIMTGGTVFPVLAMTALPKLWPWAGRRLYGPGKALLDSNPIGVVFNVTPPFGTKTLVEAVGRMVVGETVIGLLAIAFAVVRLRPASRAVYDAAGRSALLKLLRVKARRRRPCGDDPVLWREMTSTHGHKAWERVILAVGSLTYLVPLLYLVFVFARPAFWECLERGYGASPPGARPSEVAPFVRMIAFGKTSAPPTGLARDEFNGLIRQLTAFFYFFWVLFLPSLASESVSNEKERETWLGLIATPLTGLEILRGKMLGAVWRARLLLSLLLGIWLLGAALGAVHPLGLLLSAVALALSSWFAAALGVHVATWAANRSQAGSRLALPVMLMVFSGVLLAPIPGLRRTIFLGTASMSVIGGLSVLSYDDVRSVAEGRPGFPGFSAFGRLETGEGAGAVLSMVGLGLGLQLAGAVYFTRAAFLGFDRAVGRPTRPRSPRSEPERGISCPPGSRPAEFPHAIPSESP